ncbi:MAG: hypothetical protein KC731_10145 [Myxococcales bacterium]|nr:hypothetical protein [Myxococcales bacterium]
MTRPLIALLCLISLAGCTARGGYEERVVDLDDRGRELVRRTLTMIDEAITKSFLVAYPEKGACDYCDYQRICGPHELLRIRKKPALKQLDHLRDLP